MGLAFKALAKEERDRKHNWNWLFSRFWIDFWCKDISMSQVGAHWWSRQANLYSLYLTVLYDLSSLFICHILGNQYLFIEWIHKPKEQTIEKLFGVQENSVEKRKSAKLQWKQLTCNEGISKLAKAWMGKRHHCSFLSLKERDSDEMGFQALQSSALGGVRRVQTKQCRYIQFTRVAWLPNERSS